MRMYLFPVWALNKDVLVRQVLVQKALFVQIFQSTDNFHQNFSCLLNAEHIFGEFGLVCGQISSLKILVKEVDVVLVSHLL